LIVKRLMFYLDLKMVIYTGKTNGIDNQDITFYDRSYINNILIKW